MLKIESRLAVVEDEGYSSSPVLVVEFKTGLTELQGVCAAKLTVDDVQLVESRIIAALNDLQARARAETDVLVALVRARDAAPALEAADLPGF